MRVSTEAADDPTTSLDRDREFLEPETAEPALDTAPAGVQSLSGRQVLAVALTMASGAVLAWFVPLAGVIVAWPFLFAVPGWALVSRCVPHLAAPGRVGLAIVTSVYLSAHMTNVVARAGGFSRAAVLVTIVLLALGTVILIRVRHPWLAAPSRPSLAEIRRSLLGDREAWLIAAAVGLTILAILGFNGWRQTADGVVSGGWNWSDLLVHVSIGSSIQHGNFPPEVPYFAGEPLTYHWFADFHGAIVATAADVEIVPVFFMTSALLSAALAMLVWALALQLTRRRRVATIAAILVCFGGGMGWIRLIGDLATGVGTPIDLITQHPYDNTWEDDWPFFRIASILGTGLLPHRATTLGLPGLVAVVLLVASSLNRRPAGILLAGMVAGLLAPFQFFAFPASYLIVLLYVVMTRPKPSRALIRDAMLFVVPAALAIPFIAGAVAQQGDIGAFRPVLGWSEARFAGGPAAVVFFYITNLGLPFVLAAVAAVAVRSMPSRGFLAAWTLTLFFIPNLVVVSAVEFDMNKYFQMMWIAVAILAAGLIRRWPIPAIAAVLLFSSISPALVGLWHTWSPSLVMPQAQLDAARWIEANTPERAVFVTEAFINSPIDLAGRRRISTFGPYVANLGYEPQQREADTLAIYCDGADEAAERMATYGATHVLSSGGTPACAGPPTNFQGSPRFETIYDVNGVSVWRLVDP